MCITLVCHLARTTFPCLRVRFWLFFLVTENIVTTFLILLFRILEKQESGVAPHFVQPLKPKTTKEDQPVTLTCKVEGKPTPEVKWYIDEEEIVEDTRREIRYNSKTGEAYLKIHKAKPEDEVIYRCQAVNKFGRAECRTNIIVGKPVEKKKPEKVKPPKITKPLDAKFVTKGTDVTLDVEFEGTPKPEVKWFKNSKKIVEKENITVEEKRTILKIRKVKKQDGGKYEVKATNPGGEAKTSGTLQVTEQKSPDEKEVKPPRFIKALVPQFAAEGEVVILEAVVESHPTCSFQWYQRATPIKVSIITTTTGSSFLFLFFLLTLLKYYFSRRRNIAS